MPEKLPMPLFILFDSQSGYLYGHLLASGPDDPFLKQILDWWATHCAGIPVGLDDPNLPLRTSPQPIISSN